MRKEAMHEEKHPLAGTTVTVDFGEVNFRGEPRRVAEWEEKGGG